MRTFTAICLLLTVIIQGNVLAQQSDPYSLREASARLVAATSVSQSGKPRGPAASVDEFSPATLRPRGVGQNLYPQVAPAVVLIMDENGSGTGFLISEDGWIVTNHHVVKGTPIDQKRKANRTQVLLGKPGEDGWMQQNGDVREAYVWKHDSRRDLALLRIEPVDDETLPFLELADARPLPGTDCVAIGHPGIGQMWSVRSGDITGGGTSRSMTQVFTAMQRVSQDERNELLAAIEGMQGRILQSDLDIHPGDSGGPIVNAQGQVIGVTFAYRADGATSLSLHVDLEELRDFLAERPESPQLLLPDLPSPEGLRVGIRDQDENGIVDLMLGEDDDSLVYLGLHLGKTANLKEVTSSEMPTLPAAHFSMRLSPALSAAYDVDLDGEVDLLLADQDGDLEFDSIYRISNGEIETLEIPDNPIDGSLFENKGAAKRFQPWEAAVRGLLKDWRLGAVLNQK